ncbi:MAG: hypothetical protein C0467_16930 [Planctomycetaceae bacterium]|nr:hypothetical protein [Planctomycetaceae bacterium]
MARRSVTDLVEADLPITPMLDMSFQLLAFFIMTFRPTPTEGQIAVELPPIPGGPESTAVAIPETAKPAHHIVLVQATEQGTIASITLREEGAPGDREISADAKVLLKELKAITTAASRQREGGARIPPPRVTIEIGDRLLQASVIQVFDAARQAGFTDITTVPIDKKKR